MHLMKNDLPTFVENEVTAPPRRRWHGSYGPQPLLCDMPSPQSRGKKAIATGESPAAPDDYQTLS